MKIVAISLAVAAFIGQSLLGTSDPVVHRATTPTPDTSVVRVSGGAMDSAFRSLAASSSSADIARDLPTGDLSRYQFVALSRRVAGPPELHERWSDIVVVRTGAAVLRTGRTLQARHALGQGEYSGYAIASGRDQSVGPGDMVVIPAGLAHQWRPIGNAAFSYVVLKVHPDRAHPH